MPEASYSLDELNFLVVDDNENMRVMIQSILFALGVRKMRVVSSVAEAVKVMKKFQADIVLTDWHMEPQDGIDLVRIIRNSKDSPNPYVPIIMLTGHTELQRVIDARDAGVNEFLAKPLSAKSLYGRIATIIESPRPFVRTKEYFGPCRRRQNLGPQGGMKERRHDELAKMAEAEGLSPEEFEELMLLQSPD